MKYLEDEKLETNIEPLIVHYSERNKDILNRFFIIIGILLFEFTYMHGQTFGLNGVVKDSINAIPLANANILAFPKNPDESTRFAISNESGSVFWPPHWLCIFVIRQSKSTIRQPKRGIRQFNGY